MSGDLGNSYNIDIWGLLIALGMVAVAAIISELMHMGIGKTLMWSSCRALVQLCAMGFIIGYVIRSNNVWMVFSLMAVIQAVGFFFGHGSGNYISRQLGRHETADAEKMAATGVTLAFLAGCVILALGQIFLTPLARLLGSTDTILPYAESYARIILLAAPVMCASFVLSNVLRAEGGKVRESNFRG